MDSEDIWEGTKGNKRNFVVDEILFEWDERKNEKNIVKHGISFETAAYVFLDENLLDLYDEDHSDYGEDRYIAIGKVEDVLYVVYTERGERIRLISARLAEKPEIDLYYNR